MRNEAVLINGNIRTDTVRLIQTDGTQQVVPTRQAQDLARNAGLDLVQVADSNPPVVKIIDYSKFKFDLQKKEKEASKKNRASRIEVKELQFRPVTDIHDVQRLIKHANKFLEEGHKVRLVCKFRGRENMHRENGFNILKTILADVQGTQEGNISNQERNISVTISAIHP